MLGTKLRYEMKKHQESVIPILSLEWTVNPDLLTPLVTLQLVISAGHFRAGTAIPSSPVK